MKRYACTAYDGSRENIAVLIGNTSLLSFSVSDQRGHSLAYVSETVLTPEETGQSCRKLRQFCGSCRSCAASSAVRPCENTMHHIGPSWYFTSPVAFFPDMDILEDVVKRVFSSQHATTRMYASSQRMRRL